MLAEDLEAYVNAFEQMATTMRWAPQQWVAVLIPCLISPTQVPTAIDTLPASELNDYMIVRAAILQTLDFSR